MRAQWFETLSVEDYYKLSGDSLHHLVNVIRIERGEELLLLNGKGLCVETLVEEISKKELKLKRIAHEQVERRFHLDLALGMPKRDALDLCLKEAAELGIQTVYLIKSEYSQMKFPEDERIHKILVSALEQSNAPFLPQVVQSSWEELPWREYTQITMLDSQSKTSVDGSINESAFNLLVVGPEGGFSPIELKFLHAQENLGIVNLPTPILRTPTAVAAGAGFILQSLLK